MALSRYQGTTNLGGSNSGWEARFVTHFCDATGAQYRVEIIDSQLTQTDFNWTLDAPKEFVCGSDGFTLTHEGSPDNLHQSIIASSLTMDFLVQNANDEKLFTALTSTTDHRFGVVVYNLAINPSSTQAVPVGSWAIEWAGVINPEGVSLELGESSKFLRLDAVDGLALLNDIPYLDDSGNAFDTWQNLVGVIGQCLKHIPTASLWGFQNGSSASNVNSSTASTLTTALSTVTVAPLSLASAAVGLGEQTLNGGAPVTAVTLPQHEVVEAHVSPALEQFALSATAAAETVEMRRAATNFMIVGWVKIN